MIASSKLPAPILIIRSPSTKLRELPKPYDVRTCLTRLEPNRAVTSRMQALERSFLDGRVVVMVGDITQQAVRAIVNAANSSLLGGAGVDGAIHTRGGPQILAECREIRKTIYPQGLPTGRAVLTTAGALPADYVIHTVGPVYGENKGRDAELLAACYENSLLLAREHSLTSVA